MIADGRQDATLDLDDGSFVTPEADLERLLHEHVKDVGAEFRVFVFPHLHLDVLARRSHFQIAKGDAVVHHTLEPLVAELKDTVNSFVRWPEGQLRSTAHLLMQAVFQRPGDAGTVYLQCARVATFAQLPWGAIVRDRYCTILLERLQADDQVAPAVADEVLTFLLPRKALRVRLVHCGLSFLGRDPASDPNLVAKLQVLVDTDFATQEPVAALEAWLRLTELGLVAQGVLSSPAALFRLIAPAAIRESRRELITRVRWAITDLGAQDDLPEAWRTQP
ncbi:hypothetical protein [Actinophytocola glycyrrhizae]|uniref:Uncharacterized protein n=1 Tax=Actinophytocola glycyrrhizae TaxID=2044873 RepID=A0ABV9RU56_9PSEU